MRWKITYIAEKLRERARIAREVGTATAVARELRVLSRKSYEAYAVSVFDNPISSRFDENDALIYFDDVKLPWDRVFVHRDTDMCRAQFHDTPGHAYQNYQAQIRLSVKITFLAGLARLLTQAIPGVAEQLGMLAAQSGMVNAVLSGMEASGSQIGEWYVPNKHFMHSAQVITQDLYPKVINTIRDLAGGALVMLPSSVADFGNPEVKAIIERTQRSAAMDPEHKVKFVKAAWDAIGPEFGSRHPHTKCSMPGHGLSPAATARAPTTGTMRPLWWRRCCPPTSSATNSSG